MMVPKITKKPVPKTQAEKDSIAEKVAKAIHDKTIGKDFAKGKTKAKPKPVATREPTFAELYGGPAGKLPSSDESGKAYKKVKEKFKEQAAKSELLVEGILQLKGETIEQFQDRCNYGGRLVHQANGKFYVGIAVVTKELIEQHHDNGYGKCVIVTYSNEMSGDATDDPEAVVFWYTEATADSSIGVLRAYLRDSGYDPNEVWMYFVPVNICAKVLGNGEVR